jgi:hypothetical protein
MQELRSSTVRCDGTGRGVSPELTHPRTAGQERGSSLAKLVVHGTPAFGQILHANQSHPGT